jgi:hypothetical protein
LFVILGIEASFPPQTDPLPLVLRGNLSLSMFIIPLP